MTWANVTHDYQEGAMGYPLQPGLGQLARAGLEPPPVCELYAESHDEERLMYKNLQFGNDNGGYDALRI